MLTFLLLILASIIWAEPQHGYLPPNLPKNLPNTISFPPPIPHGLNRISLTAQHQGVSAAAAPYNSQFQTSFGAPALQLPSSHYPSTLQLGPAFVVGSSYRVADNPSPSAAPLPVVPIQSTVRSQYDSNNFVPIPNPNPSALPLAPLSPSLFPHYTNLYHRNGPQLLYHPSSYHPQIYHHPHTYPSPGIVRNIYVHLPPSDIDGLAHPQPVLVEPPKQHYRIIFIKTPSANRRTTQPKVIHSPTEEKTIIYVLSKKEDHPDPALHLHQQQKHSKPEVYFIKYKTQEEAKHAQQKIQAQFDALGGTTQIANEEISPVTSFSDVVQIGGNNPGLHASSSQAQISHAAHGGHVLNSISPSPIDEKSQYLPPNKFH